MHRLCNGAVLAEFVEELHKRLGSSRPDSCGRLFCWQQIIPDPAVVRGSLGKSLRYNRRLIELDAKSEVYQRMEKA